MSLLVCICTKLNLEGCDPQCCPAFSPASCRYLFTFLRPARNTLHNNTLFFLFYISSLCSITTYTKVFILFYCLSACQTVAPCGQRVLNAWLSGTLIQYFIHGRGSRHICLIE